MNEQLSKAYYTTIAHTFQHVIDLNEQDLLNETALQSMKKLHDVGIVWNSGGGCMILSIEMPKVVECLHRWMHISDEHVVVYEDENLETVQWLNDECAEIFSYEVQY